MLDTRQLTALQSYASRTLDLSAQITRNTGTGSDIWGHPNETWTPVPASGAAVACALTEPSAQVMAKYADLIGSQRAWKVSFPYGTDIKRNDRIAVGGQTMRVQVDETLGSYSTLTQVLATEVNETVR